MDVLTLRSHIINGGYSNEDLELLGQGMRIARERLVNKVKSGLSIGDNVSFASSRTGKNITGVVEKIAVKYVTVRTIEGGWRVPANMLTAV
jgi:ssDNA-binding replication factor A large subunit